MEPSGWAALVVRWPLLTLDSLILPPSLGFRKAAALTQTCSYSRVSLLPVFLLVTLWGWSLSMNSYGKSKHWPCVAVGTIPWATFKGSYNLSFPHDLYLLVSVKLVYFYDFLFKLKTATITTSYSTGRYKANILLAYCQGNNVCGLNSRGGERDFVTDVISFSLSQKLPCVCKLITQWGLCSKLSKEGDAMEG